MKDFTHLNALLSRLEREKERLNQSTNDNDRKYRKVQIAQVEKEIQAEREFLGISEEPEMSDRELLKQLGL